MPAATPINELVETVRTVHEAGTIAKAAPKLHLCESAVQHRILKLEKMIGYRVLNRRNGSKSPLTLTKQGKELLERWGDEAKRPAARLASV